MQHRIVRSGLYLDRLGGYPCNRLPRNLTRAEWNLYLGNVPYRATCANLPVEPEVPPTSSP